MEDHRSSRRAFLSVTPDIGWVEEVGGWHRLHHLVPLLLHTAHVMAGIVVILSRLYNGDPAFLEPDVVHYLSIYAVLMILAFLAHVLLASPLYAWAWHYPEPQELSKRRCTYGCMMDFFFGDLPTFVMGTKMVYTIQFRAATLGVAYCLSCISFFYTSLRVWLFFVQHVAKIHFLYEEKRSHPPYRPDDIRDAASLSFAFRLYNTPQGPIGDQTACTVQDPIQTTVTHSSPPPPSTCYSSSSFSSSNSLSSHDDIEDGKEGLHPRPMRSPASSSSTEAYSGGQESHRRGQSHPLNKPVSEGGGSHNKKNNKEENKENPFSTFTSAAPSTTSFSSFSSSSSSHNEHEEDHHSPHHHLPHEEDGKDDFSSCSEFPKDQKNNWQGEDRRWGTSYPLKYSRFQTRDMTGKRFSNHLLAFRHDEEEKGSDGGGRGTNHKSERRRVEMKTEEIPPKRSSSFLSSMPWRVRPRAEADSRGEEKERDNQDEGTPPPLPQGNLHQSFLPSSFLWKPHPDRKYRVEDEGKKRRLFFRR